MACWQLPADLAHCLDISAGGLDPSLPLLSTLALICCRVESDWYRFLRSPTVLPTSVQDSLMYGV